MAPQPQPIAARLGVPPHSPPLPLVPLGLTVLLALLVWAAASQAHLLAAARLVPWIGTSPWPAFSTEQMGKLMALGGLAALAGGCMLLLLHLPHARRDRRLTGRMAALLAGGGIVYFALDTAPMLDLLPSGQARGLCALAEEAVQWSVLAGAALLLARRWLMLEWHSDPSLGKSSAMATWLRRPASTPMPAAAVSGRALGLPCEPARLLSG